MWLDERLEFADDEDVAAAAGTALIGDVINMSVVRDIGQGHPIYLAILTGGTEIITGGTAGTLKFQFVSDAQAAIDVTNPTTASVHLQTQILVTDDAAANTDQFNVGGVIYFGAIPAEGMVYEQYLGILAVTATTTTTAGTINAFLTLDPHGWRSYADNEK